MAVGKQINAKGEGQDLLTNNGEEVKTNCKMKMNPEPLAANPKLKNKNQKPKEWR